MKTKNKTVIRSAKTIAGFVVVLVVVAAVVVAVNEISMHAQLVAVDTLRAQM